MSDKPEITLEGQAVSEILKDAKRGKELAKDLGALAWQKRDVLPNKTFINNTLVSTLRHSYREERKRKDGSNRKYQQHMATRGRMGRPFYKHKHDYIEQMEPEQQNVDYGDFDASKYSDKCTEMYIRDSHRKHDMIRSNFVEKKRHGDSSDSGDSFTVDDDSAVQSKWKPDRYAGKWEDTGSADEYASDNDDDMVGDNTHYRQEEKGNKRIRPDRKNSVKDHSNSSSSSKHKKVRRDNRTSSDQEDRYSKPSTSCKLKDEYYYRQSTSGDVTDMDKSGGESEQSEDASPSVPSVKKRINKSGDKRKKNERDYEEIINDTDEDDGREKSEGQKKRRGEHRKDKPRNRKQIPHDGKKLWEKISDRSMYADIEEIRQGKKPKYLEHDYEREVDKDYVEELKLAQEEAVRQVTYEFNRGLRRPFRRPFRGPRPFIRGRPPFIRGRPFRGHPAFRGGFPMFPLPMPVNPFYASYMYEMDPFFLPPNINPNRHHHLSEVGSADKYRRSRSSSRSSRSYSRSISKSRSKSGKHKKKSRRSASSSSYSDRSRSRSYSKSHSRKRHSRSPSDTSRSRSRSVKRDSRSHSDRSHSGKRVSGSHSGHKRSKSRSRSQPRSHSRRKSRSHSRSKSRSHSRGKSRSHSQSKSRSHSRRKSRSHSRRKSRSHSRRKSRSRSSNNSRSGSRRKSRKHSDSDGSQSRNPSRRKHSKSHKKSKHSKSRHRSRHSGYSDQSDNEHKHNHKRSKHSSDSDRSKHSSDAATPLSSNENELSEGKKVVNSKAEVEEEEHSMSETGEIDESEPEAGTDWSKSEEGSLSDSGD